MTDQPAVTVRSDLTVLLSDVPVGAYVVHNGEVRIKERWHQTGEMCLRMSDGYPRRCFPPDCTLVLHLDGDCPGTLAYCEGRDVWSQRYGSVWLWRGSRWDAAESPEAHLYPRKNTNEKLYWPIVSPPAGQVPPWPPRGRITPDDLAVGDTFYSNPASCIPLEVVQIRPVFLGRDPDGVIRAYDPNGPLRTSPPTPEPEPERPTWQDIADRWANHGEHVRHLDQDLHAAGYRVVDVQQLGHVIERLHERRRPVPECGYLMEWSDCWAGCDDGYVPPLLDDLGPWPDDPWTPCDTCDGNGGWYWCPREADHQPALKAPYAPEGDG